MIVKSLETLTPVLASPKTRQALHSKAGGLQTAEGDEMFEAADGVPVLVDFDASVLDRETVFATRARSTISRRDYTGPTQWLKRMVSPEKPETRRNIAAFVAGLRPPTDRRPRVLVVGGGTRGQGTDALYDDPSVDILAFDIYATDQTSFIADAHQIPLLDGSVDGVIIQAVLEHVLVPETVAAEIWRVLTPEGLVYSEIPFMQHVHEGAYDFTRFSESGHRYLFRRFERIESGVCGGAGLQLMWSVDYFFRSLFRSRAAGKAAKLALFWVQYLDRIIPERYAIDCASGTFFLGRKSDRELSPKEIVAFYRGAQ